MSTGDIDMAAWVLRGSSFVSARRGRVRTHGGILEVTDGSDAVLSAPAAEVQATRADEYTIVVSSGVPVKLLFSPAIGVLRWLVPTWALVGVVSCLVGYYTEPYTALNDVSTYVGGIMILALFPVGLVFRPALRRAEDRLAASTALADWIERAGPPTTDPSPTIPPTTTSSRLMAATMGFFGGIQFSIVLRVLIDFLPDFGPVVKGILIGAALVVPIVITYRYYRRAGARLERAERLAGVGRMDDAAPSFIAYGLPFLIGSPLMVVVLVIAL